MVPALKAGWSKPSTILFATEYPVNEKAFAFALTKAVEFAAELIIFHAYNDHTRPVAEASEVRRDNYASARNVKLRFEPLAQRAMNLGIRCQIIVRPGLPADEILKFLHGRNVDRLVMGARTPGPIGKLLVGSTAEAMLRTSNVPVNLVGPNVVEGAYRNLASRTVLCSVDAHRSSRTVACFAAQLAARRQAHLVLQHVIQPQECSITLFDRTRGQIAADLLASIPASLRQHLSVQINVMLGDPAEELLYQARVLQANLIVMGAHRATHFAAVTHDGIVYKVLAYARCPVITLSPAVLAESTPHPETFRPVEVNYLAGTF